MSRMLHELSAKDVPEIRGDAFSFLNQFSDPFSSTEHSESKSAVWILPPISFPHLSSSSKAWLSPCLIKLINYCSGCCPHHNAVDSQERSCSFLPLFLKMGLDALRSFGWVLLQNPFPFSSPVEQTSNGRSTELAKTKQSQTCSVLPEFWCFGVGHSLWFPDLNREVCASGFSRVAFCCCDDVPKEFPAPKAAARAPARGQSELSSSWWWFGAGPLSPCPWLWAIPTAPSGRAEAQGLLP